MVSLQLSKEAPTEFRSLLRTIIREAIPQEYVRVALLFSGGTDSLTCLFTLLDLGIKPILYTFFLENYHSEDAKASEAISKLYDLEQVFIIIPQDRKKLEDDVVELIKELKIYRKTHVQVCYPFLYILPEIKEQFVLTGLSSDSLYGTPASMAINFKNDKEGFDSRRKAILSNPESDCFRPLTDLAKFFGKELVAPYRDKRILDFFLNFAWKELNRPKQKWLSILAFREHYEKYAIYRRNSNLQVGSRIREWHNELLDGKLNEFKRKRVDMLYRDLYEKHVEGKN